MKVLDFHIEASSLKLSAREASWDSAVYGVPVVQITEIDVQEIDEAVSEYRQFESWLSDKGIGIASCRLAHDRLRESMFLESQGFRFVEMVLHPTLESLETREFKQDELGVIEASIADVAELRAIAENAFGFERYHVDPRLNPKKADERYGRWIESSFGQSTQQLFKIVHDERLIGFFLIEVQSDKSAYWHLTAISPQWQGRGYGRRVWLAMLNYCKAIGCRSVLTTIAARNTPVLNLYSQLQFRFSPTEMTLHWIRGTE